MSAGGPEQRLGREAGAAVAFAFAVLLHAIIGIVYVSSGLLAPGWAVALLLLVWTALAVLVWRWRRRGPVVLAIPFLAAGIWALAMWLGDHLLGWTA